MNIKDNVITRTLFRLASIDLFGLRRQEEKAGESPRGTNIKDIPTKCQACGFTAKWIDFFDMNAENRKPEDEELCPKCGNNDEDKFVFVEGGAV